VTDQVTISTPRGRWSLDLFNIIENKLGERSESLYMFFIATRNERASR
jgi:hypothetical protein